MVSFTNPDLHFFFTKAFSFDYYSYSCHLPFPGNFDPCCFHVLSFCSHWEHTSAFCDSKSDRMPQFGPQRPLLLQSEHQGTTLLLLSSGELGKAGKIHAPSSRPTSPVLNPNTSIVISPWMPRLNDSFTACMAWFRRPVPFPKSTSASQTLYLFFLGHKVSFLDNDSSWPSYWWFLKFFTSVGVFYAPNYFMVHIKNGT